MTQIKLVDLNPHIISAWQGFFKDKPDVEIVQGDITHQAVDVWVTPTNSKGHMSGGVDMAIKNALGSEIEAAIQKAIAGLFGGFLPVGKAVIVPWESDDEHPRFVVATPSMVGESDNLARTKNTALACAAAFQAIYYAADHGQEIHSIAIPGLGSGTGQVHPNTCAELMALGYKLFLRKRYDSFDEMLTHLNEELGILGYHGAAKTGPQPHAGFVAQAMGVGPQGGIGVLTHEDALKGDPVLGQQAAKEHIEEQLKKTVENMPPTQIPVEVKVTKPWSSDYIKKMPIGTSIF